MTFKKALYLLMVVAIAALAVVALAPVEEAQACLPCKCPWENPPVNCFGPYTVYRHPAPGGFDIEVLTQDAQGNATDSLRITSRELAALPEFPEENTLIGELGYIQVYKLEGGAYQFNANSYLEEKVFVMIMNQYDGSLIEESSYIPAPTQ